MNINDILNSSEDMNGAMENMDVSLNYDSPELMSSEFFDSVLSLENNLEDGFFSNFEDDVNLSSDTSSHTDEVLSPQSCYSESDKNSSCAENIEESASILSSFDSLDDPILMSFLEPVPNVQIEAHNVPAILKPTIQKQPTKILIQNPNNKKFIAKPINASQIKKASAKGKPHYLKVQHVSNNGRPILLPLSVKSIKILNSPADVAALTSNLKRRNIEPQTTPAEEEDNNVVSSTNQYPPLSLSSEEKRLLTKEGIQLPTHHPLTKNEERELKRIRRKIRNKISAQDSRKRKKEYVDGLEERVKRGSEENKNLLQRVRELQRQNKTLIAHVSKLQALICNSTTSKATPSTCLMVVLLSALLVSLPNIKLFENKQISSNDQEQVAIRRSLLTTEDDGLNMEEFLVFKDEDTEFETKFGEEALDIENSTDKEFAKMLEDIGKKYDGLLSEKNSPKKSIFSRIIESVKSFLDQDKSGFGKSDYGGYYNKRGFIEPDIDDDYIPSDDDPPLKRRKYVMEEFHNSDGVTLNNEQVVATTLNTKNGINTKDK